MHVRLRQVPEVTLQVVHNGKTWAVRFERGGSAFVPRQLALQMIRDGLVTEGELSDPPPRFARNSDGSHGGALGVFDPWVAEMTT
jgi:hypothetical protein